MGSYWGADGKTVDGRYEAILKSSGGTEPYIGLSSDGNTSANSLFVTNRQELFNESGWDRQRGNTQGTLIASAARTATTQSALQTNYNARGVIVYVNVTAVGVTGGLTIYMLGTDPVSGLVTTLNSAPTVITAVGRNVVELYPGSTGTGFDVRQRTSGSLPRVWAVNIVHGDTTSYTYSVGYSLIL